jgi:DNA-binding beta-propeller fold protein YncE
MKVLTLAILSIILFNSCEEETPSTESENWSQGVYILNEGNFGFANASLDFFDFELDELNAQVFNEKNQMLLGDVLQSIYIDGDQAWLVVNNSGSIFEIDARNAELRNQISGLTSPRYFLPVSSSKAYVSDLYANRIHILSLPDLTVQGFIPVSSWTEEIAFANGKAWVCAPQIDQLLLIDVNSDNIDKSITLTTEPLSLAVARNFIYVLCSGGFSQSLPYLYKINTESGSKEDSMQVGDLSTYPSELSYDPVNDRLLWIDENGIQKCSTSDLSDFELLIDGKDRIIYGLEVNPWNGDIFVSDAKNYVERGEVFHYSSEAELLQQFPTGIIPGAFGFYRN